MTAERDGAVPLGVTVGVGGRRGVGGDRKYEHCHECAQT
jgi:hypothetical protein